MWLDKIINIVITHINHKLFCPDWGRTNISILWNLIIFLASLKNISVYFSKSHEKKRNMLHGLISNKLLLVWDTLNLISFTAGCKFTLVYDRVSGCSYFARRLMVWGVGSTPLLLYIFVKIICKLYAYDFLGLSMSYITEAGKVSRAHCKTEKYKHCEKTPFQWWSEEEKG